MNLSPERRFAVKIIAISVAVIAVMAWYGMLQKQAFIVFFMVIGIAVGIHAYVTARD